jgi:predicted esterase
MATVYLAEDLRHHRQVAVKVLRPELAAALGGARFLREIDIAARLTHPHILPLHDSGEAGAFLFYVMPLVDGESLRDRIEREGALPIPDAVRWLRDVADALAYAHAHGVVHRDIKPGNVMLSGRHAVVTDFGVAIGTPAYMAPEQATADPAVDHRADLYAFGVLAYEMLTGRPTFLKPSVQATVAAHLTEPPVPIARHRPQVSPALAAVVTRCLEKRPEDRWPSADELLAQVEAIAATPPEGSAAATTPMPRRLRLLGIAGVVVLVAGAWAVVSARRSARLQWAREIALPQIRQLADSEQWEAAFRLAGQTRPVIPKDPTFASLWARVSTPASIRSRPPGARVFRKEYTAGASAWEYLGTTPLDSIPFPRGFSQLRLQQEGHRPLEVAAYWRLLSDSPYVLPPSPSQAGEKGNGIPEDMVWVPGTHIGELNLPGLEHLGAITVGSYFIGAREVTNREFKEFVDSGGYRRREFWAEPFLLEGRPVSWDAAMARFVDKTGRAGAATWEAGDYPPGQGDFPVAGVSWYEAAAYAKFAGKALPTIHHWALAASIPASSWIVPHSNFGGKGPEPVTGRRGLGVYGTYDMAGNVREWCLNATGGERYILGGGWSDPTYAFNDAYAQPPFDRSAINGIRLAQYLPGDTTLATASRPIVRAFRDFRKERPVPDRVFAIYRRLYDYDRTPLHPVVEETDSSADDWVRQRITFDAAYGSERVIAHLLLPKHHQPPYQVVVYFPGAAALHARSSLASLVNPPFDFILKSGRAVLFPIYKSTYERGDRLATWYPEESNFYKEHVIMWAKDLRRSIDYLETRPDIDSKRLAYYGFSWGGMLGGVMPAIEPRFKAAVLLVAGLKNQRGQPEVEPVNFLPRIRVPVLMLNGRYDFYFPVEAAQRPFFRLLGTPAQHKRLVISEGGHFVPRIQLIGETLKWLDRYLGPTN